MRNARAELETELGWARSMGTRSDVERAVQLIRRLEADPSAFVRQLQTELQAGQEPVEPELTDPQPDLRSEDGKLAYSHEANLKIAQNAAERMARALRKEMAPALEYAQTGTQAAQQQEIRTQAAQDARDVFATASKLPHFTANQAAIHEQYKAINQTNPEVRQKFGSAAVLYMAYNKVLAEKVLPTLGATVERQTIADLQRSAHAGASGFTQTPPALPAKPAVREGNVDDLARDLERRYAEAAAQH